MADTGYKFPGTAVGDRAITSAVNTWGSPNNIKLDDAAEATNQSSNVDEISFGLAASNFDFTSIPIGATIDGIEVRVGDYFLAVSTQDHDWTTVRLILADNTDGSVNRFADFTDWTDTAQTDGSGNSSDLWSETINDTDVKDVDWGFFIGITSQVSVVSRAEIDFMQMKVYYSTNPSPGLVALTITGSAPLIPPSIKSVNSDAAWTDGDTNINIDGQFLI